MAKLSIDPITLEVVQNALSSIADELALVIMRAAYSNIVRDSMDYSTAVCDFSGKTIGNIFFIFPQYWINTSVDPLNT